LEEEKMRITARMVRDARGYLPLFADLYVAEMKSSVLEKEERDVWSFTATLREVKVGDLPQRPGFNLIAMRLVTIDQLDLRSCVMVGKVSTVRIVVTSNKEYRVHGHRIYEKKLKV